MVPSYHWTRFLPTPVIKNIATLGPLGHTQKAPGSVGALAGLIWFTVAFFPLGRMGYFLLLLLSAYLAVGICDEAERRLFKRDPREVVLDEFVAVPVCFIGLQSLMTPVNTWVFMLAGFALFRFFDILKPLGIDKLQSLPGGFGIVMDDVAAAAAACLSLHLLLIGLSVSGLAG